MRFMKSVVLSMCVIFLGKSLSAQDDNRPITTAVTLLLVAADARSAGMGDMGVATSSDAYSQQFNPAKYAFSESQHLFSLSYTPYLTKIANDIYLSQINYSYKLNERSALAGSLRYFGLGDIELRQTPDPNEVPRVVSPNELIIDGSYSLKLSETFSMGVGGRFISSNLKIPNEDNDASAATSFAVDVAGYYVSEIKQYENAGFDGRWRLGFNFQNMGPKISYDNDKTVQNFLPANLRLGAAHEFVFDEYNKLTAALELNKLLVPTPFDYNQDVNNDGQVDQNDVNQLNQDYRNISWVSGIFKSFGDAPDGFSEELKEFTWALAGEYSYQDSFSFRAGYLNENELKGARKYLTLGAGFKYNAIKLDVSYLFSVSKVPNPLEDTLRFSLTFNFGQSFDNQPSSTQ